MKGLLIGILTLGLLCSCGNSKNRDSVSDAGETDSIETIVKTDPSTVRFPDTVFPSVENVKYVVEVIDTTIPARLESLENLYANVPGAFTFRKGPHRDARFGGKVDSVPTRFRVEWTVATEYEKADTVFGPWGGGTGWTGQPLYVQWPDSLLKKLKNNGAVAADASGKEIIFGSLCGKIYFVDYLSGKASRDTINAGNPVKGTVSLDPTLNGNLYVGQGTPPHRPFGALAINLFTNNIFHFFPQDSKAWRGWGAYDSSPVRVDRFLFRPGENGSLYKFLIGQNTLTLQSVMRYRVNGSAPGMEASMAVAGNYGITADNHGNVLGVNLDNLKPVWHYRLPDDTDASPLVAYENDTAYVYVGCEIDKQGKGVARFAKLRVADGSEVWRTDFDGKRHDTGTKHFDGGFYASPLMGWADCSHLIFDNLVDNNTGQNGKLVAINRYTGKVEYAAKLECYSWSSPVGFETPDGKLLIVTGDGHGNLYLIEGRTGEILVTQRIGNNFESSPVVVGNTLVVGSRGNNIYKVVLE